MTDTNVDQDAQLAFERVVVGPIQTNCYLLSHVGHLVVVDAGEDPLVIKEALGDRPVDLIVSTHCHWDHNYGVDELKELTGAPFAISAIDAEGLEMGMKSGGTMYGMPEPRVPKVDQYLTDGDKIMVGDVAVSVIATPGHTPGGICLYAEGKLFSGDTLFRGSVGRTDFFGGDFDTIMQSIARLMELPDDTQVFPGHGPATTIVRERHSNPFILGETSR